MKIIQQVIVTLVTIILVKADEETCICDAVTILPDALEDIKVLIQMAEALKAQIEELDTELNERKTKIEALEEVIKEVEALFTDDTEVRSSGDFEIEREVDACSARIDELEAMRKGEALFSARRNGRMTSTGIIVFDDILVDFDGSYDPTSGQFEAPVDGIYLISLYLWATHLSEAAIQVNSQTVKMIKSKHSVMMDFGTMGASISISLKQGDIVTAELTSGMLSLEGEGIGNSFSGIIQTRIGSK